MKGSKIRMIMSLDWLFSNLYFRFKHNQTHPKRPLQRARAIFKDLLTFLHLVYVLTLVKVVLFEICFFAIYLLNMRNM